MSHTPGPWRVAEGAGGQSGLTVQVAIDACPRSIAAIYLGECDRANARLIAAAPALLEACEAVLAAYDAAYHGSRPSTAVWRGEDVDAMRATVARARAEG